MIYKKIRIYVYQRLLYRLNVFASLIFQLVTWLHQDFIFQCSNLAHQILYNFKKKSVQPDYFYMFYICLKFCPDINLHNCCIWKIAVKPVKIAQLNWFFKKLYKIFSPILWVKLEHWKSPDHVKSQIEEWEKLTYSSNNAIFN